MVSKRDFLGEERGLELATWTEWQWTRIGAVLAGLGLTVLYFRLDLFAALPDWIAAALASVPIGLLLYGVTPLSRTAALRITVSVGLGAALTTVLTTHGVVG
ncbi:hypothetical protein [Natronolimnobius baerhuensis]|uniref:Uncharacterized protein n=1 Tax=Natronolimnobius baerhuensis TaxID=253108 RepID=A0A202E5L5_9EURY|nr:hypothetical protein [Natronolimnobius baerhuensis]OVE83583.1 hypothetical protein B2G88_14200 [Natronolimnobius baerhuensis]